MKLTQIVIIFVMIYILYSITSKENFALDSATYLTDKTTFAAGQANAGNYFFKGTLKPGIRNTKTDAKYGGQTCTEFPTTIYQKLPPTDAVCSTLGVNNKDAYAPLDDSDAVCTTIQTDPATGKVSYYKTRSKLGEITFNTKFTVANQYGIVGPMNGGKTCWQQYGASLPNSILDACTPINATCGDVTVDNIPGNYTVDTTTVKAGSSW